MYVLSQACAMKLNKVFVELQPFVLVGIFHCWGVLRASKLQQACATPA